MTDLMTVTVTVTPRFAVRVDCPYSDDFIAAARQLSGHYLDGCWQFDVRSEIQVRDLLIDVYGTDGSDADQPRQTVRIPIGGFRGREFAPAGVTLVHRKYRDAAPRLAPYVAVVAGGFPYRGGSVNNPVIDAKPGTIIEVRDLPAGTARKILDEDKTATLVEADTITPQGRRAALAAERDALAARMQQINRSIAELDQEIG